MLKIFVWFIAFLVIRPNSAISGLGSPGSGPWAGDFESLYVEPLLSLGSSRPSRGVREGLFLVKTSV